MLKQGFMIAGLYLLSLPWCMSQDNRTENHMPFDPSNTASRIPVAFNSYYYSGGHRLYSMRFGYHYGAANGRHLIGVDLPIVHVIFNADYGGFENTTGVGDLQLNYLAIPYQSENILGLTKVAGYLQVSVPIGNERLGRGAGAWIYSPGVIFTCKPGHSWYFFPEIRFQLSGTEANSPGGSDVLPNLDDAQPEKMRHFSLAIPTHYVLREWKGWVGLSADYTYTNIEKNYYLFLRTEVGKMIGTHTAASLHLTRFLAGQPRLETIFRIKINFFLDQVQPIR